MEETWESSSVMSSVTSTGAEKQQLLAALCQHRIAQHARRQTAERKQADVSCAGAATSTQHRSVLRSSTQLTFMHACAQHNSVAAAPDQP
eukprot:1470559-Rhodomonas_salina.1